MPSRSRRIGDLQKTALHLAPLGDSPALRTAVTAYINASQREVERITNPLSRRVADWYLRLPHNRYVFGPAWNWLKRHKVIAFPVAYLLVVAEILLIAQSWH